MSPLPPHPNPPIPTLWDVFFLVPLSVNFKQSRVHSPFSPAALSSADKMDLATAKNIDTAVFPPQRSSSFTLHGTSHATTGNFSSLETSWSFRQAHSLPLWSAAYLWFLWWHRIMHERMLTSCQIWLALDKERYECTLKQPSKSETRKSQNFCQWYSTVQQSL